MSYLGDFAAGDTIDFKFTTRRFSTGAPYTLGGTPAVSVYKSNSTTQSTSGITLTVDFDSVTGLNHVRIDTTSDGTFYADGGQFNVVITTGTVDSVSVVGETVGRFTLRSQACLYPTTAGRKLDVSAGGEAGLDWANIGSPTTTVNLSGTTVKTATDVETDTADIQTRLPAALVSGRMDSYIGATAASLAFNLTGNITGNLSGSVGSVTGAVGSVTATVNANATHVRGTAISSAAVAGYFPCDLFYLNSQADPVDIAGGFFGGYGTTGDIFMNSLSWSGAMTAIDMTKINNIASAAQINAEVDTALADINLDHLVKNAVDTDFATTVHLNSVIGHLADNGTSATFDRATDSLEALQAAFSAVPESVWDEVQEGGYTARQIHELSAAVLLGISSGFDTGSVVFKGIDGTTTRVAATVDSFGNRSGFTITPRAA